MDTETIVRLKIISDLRTPEQITNTVGITPDMSWHIGDFRAKSSIVEKRHGWCIHSGLPRTASLMKHINALFAILSSHVETIKRISGEDTVELSIVIYSSSQPALHFDKEVVEKIGEFGASFDIDLYTCE